MMRRKFQIAVEWNKCRGCRLCEVACSRFHYDVINPELSRIRVYEFYPGPIYVPITCSYCSDTPCVIECPTNALYYDEESFLLKVDKQKCLGVNCAACMRACKEKRSNAIHFYPPDHSYPIVCDKCGGEPQCIKACPFDALRYVPQILKGHHFADSAGVIAEDIAEQWYPAEAKKRIKINF